MGKVVFLKRAGTYPDVDANHTVPAEVRKGRSEVHAQWLRLAFFLLGLGVSWLVAGA